MLYKSGSYGIIKNGVACLIVAYYIEMYIYILKYARTSILFPLLFLSSCTSSSSQYKIFIIIYYLSVHITVSFIRFRYLNSFHNYSSMHMMYFSHTTHILHIYMYLHEFHVFHLYIMCVFLFFLSLISCFLFR